MADPKQTIATGVEDEDTSPTQTDGFDRPASPKRGVDKIPRQFGRYKIIDCLGRGGMGAVFRAQDTQLDREVALKVPFLGDDEEDTRQRFYREARAAATLHHANICPVFDVGEFQGVPYLTMAFIEGKSLHHAMAQRQNFTHQHIALLTRKLALAMQEAHGRGVVHRDLKPSNIILRPNNEPTIMDFGLARRADDKKSAGLTQQGDIVGTVDYMSPEQVEGKNDVVGPGADIYSLGVILYELLTGRLPYEGSTTGKLAAILVKDPPKPRELRSDVPSKLEEVCLKAMAKKSADRYQSMAQFAAALADYLRAPNQQPVAPPKPSAPSPPPAPTSAPSSATAETVTKPKPEPKPAEAEVQTRPASPSGGKSAARSSKRRSGSSRRRKSKRPSPLPWIVGAVLALLVVGGGVVAAIIYATSDTPDTSVVQTTQPQTGPAAPTRPGPGPGKPTQPKKPGISRPKQPPLGFAMKMQPASATLAVGQPQKISVKIERSAYQGPVRVAWQVPREMRTSPAGPITLHPGQADAVIILRVLSEPADQRLKVAFTASAVDDPSRKPIASEFDLQVTSGACARVIELSGPPNFVVAAAAFTPGTDFALVGGGARSQGPQGGPGVSNEERHAIQVWHLERGEPVSKLVMHGGLVKRLSISADGITGLSVSADSTVGLWDIKVGQKKQQSTKLPNLRLLDAAISEDGKRGLVAYAGLVVRVNLTDFKPIGREVLTAPLMGSKLEDAVRTVAVSADKKGLIGGVDGKLFLLDLTGKTKPKALKEHSEIVLATAFSPTEHMAASAGGGILQVGTVQPGKDNAIRLWDVANASLIRKLEGHNNSVVCLAFSSDGKLLASGSADGEIRVWNSEDGKPIATFTGHSGRIVGLAFTPESNRLWSGAADRTLRQWKLP